MAQSDRDSTVDELKALATKFTAERDWEQFHNPKDLAIGIVTEAAEVLQHFRFKSPDEVARLLGNKRNLLPPTFIDR